MATPQARIKAIFDALLNSNASVELITRGVEGLIGASGPTGIGGPAGAPVAPLTNAQKAELALKTLRGMVKDMVRRNEGREAVVAASSTVAAKVDADFNEAP